MRILVVEDNKDLSDLLVEKLIENEYVVDSCYDGKTALYYIKNNTYDAAIFDIMIPKIDGYNLLNEMRNTNIFVPVMFLTCLGEAEDIVKGLDMGADDYMTKPFDFNVLLARLRALMRKSVGVHDNTYRCDDLELNETEHTVTRNNDIIELTSREFAILLYMIRNKDIVLTREQLLNSVWLNGDNIESNVVDVYVRYLRKKIDEPYKKKLIHTVRGLGYYISSKDLEL